MKKTYKLLRIVLLIVAIVLIVSSAGYFIYYSATDKGRDIDIDDTAAFLNDIIPERSAGLKDGRSNMLMPSMEYNGISYAGVIDIPAFDVKLPICVQWDKRLVNSVPCRFCGNPYDGSLVIGGVDKEGQFDFITTIDIGDKLTVTDMAGYEYSYSVAAVKRSKDADAETLTGTGYDLVLYAKQSGIDGKYVLVCCSIE